ncbi:hypothetical protein N9242_05110 [Vicingaceae bacterium]|nr:hypothetical protein [Vicingaceae bacterium]
MRIILWVIDILAIILSILWYFEERAYEPIITGILSLGGLVALLTTKSKNEKIVMKQKAGKKSRQFQSGGDMKINEE